MSRSAILVCHHKRPNGVPNERRFCACWGKVQAVRDLLFLNGRSGANESRFLAALVMTTPETNRSSAWHVTYTVIHNTFFQGPTLDVVIHLELVGMRTQAHGVHFLLALVVDVGVQHLLGENVAF